MGTAILWFRRDLRLDDNPALHAALKAGHCVLPLYIHAPEEEAPWPPGAASRWWLHHALAVLGQSLRKAGSGLVLRAGDSLRELERIIDGERVEAVYWNRLYEPAAIERDSRIKRALRDRGIRVESHNGTLLVEPWQVATARGDPYKVFTPFWTRASEFIADCRPLPAPKRLPDAPESFRRISVPLDALALLPTIPWDAGFADHWQPGEHGAHERWAVFRSRAITDYREQRDFPDRDGTSRLSPHLHFGELSARRIVADVRAARRDGATDDAGRDFYLRELGWREFSHHLLYHFPHTANAPLNARFEDFPWRDDPNALREWQRGDTGIPIVDAGMRQLWRTGWMHNRLRMVVASVLTKNLRLHWLHGACWFWDTLLDADLANNTQGWQWVAGSGADAAPYFRIFNPVMQGQRFDPEARFVSAWIPELRSLPVAWRHAPWTAPVEVLDKAGIARDSVYRRPILDVKATREAALAAFRSMSASN